MAKHDHLPVGQEGDAATPRRSSGLFLITVLVISLLPTVVVWRDRGLPSEALDLFVFISMPLVLVFGIRSVVQWRAAGAVLVDCGPAPYTKLSLFAGGMMLLAIALQVISLFTVEVIDWVQLMDELRMPLALALIGLGAATNRLQIRENGIWCNQSLVKWEALADHYWHGEGRGTLSIQFRKPFSVMASQAKLTVPPALEEAVEAAIAGSRTEAG